MNFAMTRGENTNNKSKFRVCSCGSWLKILALGADEAETNSFPPESRREVNTHSRA